MPRAHTQNDQPGTSRSQPIKQYQTEDTLMEEGEISIDSELAPSVIEVPTITWAIYIGVKSGSISRWVTLQKYKH